MCWCGTVPTSPAGPSARMPSADPAPRTLRTSVPQVFTCGIGCPVEPEVKAIAATCSAGNDGTGGEASSVGHVGGTSMHSISGYRVAGIRQADHARIAPAKLPQHGRHVVGRQQADLPARQCRPKADGEGQAVAAQVQHILPIGEPFRQGRDRAEEAARSDRPAAAQRHRSIGS